jgi:succinoglycan biosynthesis protein ExoO
VPHSQLDPRAKENGPAAHARERSVSVIMANYNGARFLSDAIDSVLAQTLGDLELIICDDCSTDDSAGIIERYQSADHRVRLLRNETNSGPAAARNRAIAAATGTWLAIVDSDDVMHPSRLEFLIASARRDGADIVADDMLVFYDGNERPSRGLLSGPYAKMPFSVDLADFIRSNAFYSNGAGLGYLKPVIRAKRLRQVSVRYDETLTIGEDYDLVCRLLASGLAYRVYPRQLYYYRKHGGSISHRLSTKAALAMLDADRRSREDIAGRGPEVRAAFEARHRSLERVLAFNALIDALKNRCFARAAGLVLRRPRLLILLKEPALSWFERLLRRGRPKRPLATASLEKAAS